MIKYPPRDPARRAALELQQARRALPTRTPARRARVGMLHAGDITICDIAETNPNRRSLTGHARRDALIAYRDGVLRDTLQAWYVGGYDGHDNPVRLRREDSTRVNWASVDLGVP